MSNGHCKLKLGDHTREQCMQKRWERKNNFWLTFFHQSYTQLYYYWSWWAISSPLAWFLVSVWIEQKWRWFPSPFCSYSVRWFWKMSQTAYCVRFFSLSLHSLCVCWFYGHNPSNWTLKMSSKNLSNQQTEENHPRFWCWGNKQSTLRTWRLHMLNHTNTSTDEIRANETKEISVAAGYLSNG